MIGKALRRSIVSLFLFRRRFDPHHRADRFGRAGQRRPAELTPFQTAAVSIAVQRVTCRTASSPSP